MTRRILPGAFVAAALLLAAGHEGLAQLVPPTPKTSLNDLYNTPEFKTLKDGVLKTLKDINDKGDAYYKDLEKLSPDDDQYEPDYNPPGTPDLPSLCKNSNECSDCYKQPYADLQNTRFRFDKLRRLNRVTKTMLRDSFSFGDAAANAAGGIAGLAWSKEKEKIRASEASFNNAYDAKLAELLATLQKNLMGIAACEAKIFGNENWYERFGFFYHQFMAEAYRRPD
jgi:hypothetical protein